MSLLGVVFRTIGDKGVTPVYEYDGEPLYMFSLSFNCSPE